MRFVDVTVTGILKDSHDLLLPPAPLLLPVGDAWTRADRERRDTAAVTTDGLALDGTKAAGRKPIVQDFIQRLLRCPGSFIPRANRDVLTRDGLKNVDVHVIQLAEGQILGHASHM